MEKHQKINLSNFKISPEVFKMVPLELMKRHCFVPFDLHKECLSIAIADPSDPVAAEQIRMVTGCELELFMAPQSAIVECQKKYLPDLYGSGEEQSLVVDYSEIGSGGEAVSEASLADSGSRGAIVGIVDKMLELAVRRNASDIHLEPQEQNLFVRFRIDGILNSIHRFPKNVQPPLISRIKVISGMDITEKRIPQDGQFSMNILRKNIDFRVSTLPGKYGEKTVIRVLDKSSFAIDLSQLGFDPMMQSTFESMIQKPQGLLLVTGPTGSGKSTTLYAVLNRLRSPVKNVITLEDPIEYELLAGKSNESGITQVQVNPKVGMTFAAGLRASLRQDPDIIMVGEIRDKETVEIAMKSSMTGHLVLSTLHTNDAISTIMRLRDMGVEAYLINSTIVGILAQRLVRLLCPSCRAPYRLPGKALKAFFSGTKSLPPDLTLYRAKGCDQCQMTGYKGRKGIFELLTMNEELRQMISAGNVEGIHSVMKNAVPQTLQESGLELVKEGLTTVEEIFRITVE